MFLRFLHRPKGFFLATKVGYMSQVNNLQNVLDVVRGCLPEHAVHPVTFEETTWRRCHWLFSATRLCDHLIHCEHQRAWSTLIALLSRYDHAVPEIFGRTTKFMTKELRILGFFRLESFYCGDTVQLALLTRYSLGVLSVP